MKTWKVYLYNRSVKYVQALNWNDANILAFSKFSYNNVHIVTEYVTNKVMA